MTVQLHFRGQLAIAADAQTEEINPRPGTTVADIIKAAAARHGEAFSKLVLAPDGNVGSSLLVALDGEQVQDPAATGIPETAKEITLLPPIAGG